MRLAASNQHRIEYPELFAFMYSPLPISYRYLGTDAVSGSVTVQVTSNDTRQTFSETREISPSGTASFDISRICQELAPDVDEFINAINTDSDEGFSLSTQFALAVSVKTGNLVTNVVPAQPLYLRFGACDPGEVYSTRLIRRHIFNYYPQTIAVYGSKIYPAAILGKDGKTPLATFGDCKVIAEISLGNVIDSYGLDYYEEIWNSQVMDLYTYGQKYRDGEVNGSSGAIVRIEIDNTPWKAPGRYFLRWLNRRGELRYWLFYGGDYKVATAVSESFTQLQGYEAYSLSGGATVNPDKQNLSTTRTLTLGAPGVSAEDFDMLTELGASPVVHLLTYPDDAAPFYKVWERVNVQTGTFTRSKRRETPQALDFEITITLRELNNPKI